MTDDDARPVVARGLVKRYGDIVAVDHVDLTVEPGDVYGFLGPNGAGKTTTLRMLLGLIRPTGGAVPLFGRDPLVDGARALDGVAGFVEGPRFYPYLSGRKNLELLANYDRMGTRRTDIDEVLDLVELRDRAKDRVGGYSTGCASASVSQLRSSASRSCCCSTSPLPGSIPPACATCALSCGRWQTRG